MRVRVEVEEDGGQLVLGSSAGFSPERESLRAVVEALGAEIDSLFRSRAAEQAASDALELRGA